MKRTSVKKFPGVFYRESLKRSHNGKPDKAYSICYSYNGRKIWKTVGWSSLGVAAQEVHEIRMEILTRIKMGQYRPNLGRKAFTLGEALDLWANKGITEGRKSFNTERGRVKKYASELLNLPIDNITTDKLDKVKYAALEQSSPESTKKIFTILQAAINLSIKRKYWYGLNPFSPLSGFVKPKVNNRGERFLSPEEAKNLLAELERSSPKWRDMAYLSLKTGLRLTEIFDICGQDIDLENKLLIIRAKGGARQPVLVTDDVLTILLKYRRGSADRLFTSKTGKRFFCSSQGFLGPLEATGLNNGVTDRKHKVWFHTLRHTFASWLAQAGVDIYAIKELMRHKNIEMTQRYAHLIPNQQREHLKVIGERLQMDI